MINFKLISNLKFKISNFQKGSLLLEAFIAVMIIGIAFGALLDVGTLAVKTSTSIEKSSQANFLLKEEMEAARSFRDGTTWATNGLGASSTITPGNNYHMVLNSNAWTVVAGVETIGIFTRKVVFDKVSRDPSTQNIESVYNASHDDPNTKKATVTVSFESTTLTLSTYLTNWK